MSAGDDESAPTVEQQLDALQRASEERRAELREIVAQLPEVMSRRAILRAVAADIRHAPEKGDLADRGIRKVGRTLGYGARTLKRLVIRSDR